MTTLLAFTTGLFGGILFGYFGRGVLIRISNLLNVKDTVKTESE